MLAAVSVGLILQDGSSRTVVYGLLGVGMADVVITVAVHEMNGTNALIGTSLHHPAGQVVAFVGSLLVIAGGVVLAASRRDSGRVIA
jgi:hypothetical protein